MPKAESSESPKGWLIDPHNKWAIHFDLKESSSDQNVSSFTIDMWGVDQFGNPKNFKSRRKASKQESLKTWKQLISSNWTEVDLPETKTA